MLRKPVLVLSWHWNEYPLTSERKGVWLVWYDPQKEGHEIPILTYLYVRVTQK